MFQSTSLEEPVSVRYVTQLIRSCIENICPYFAIEGELSNVRLIASGHLYFSIKDPNDEAMLHGALFGFKRKYHQVPKNGDLVIIQGKLSIYAQRSTYQLIADTLIYAGIGKLIRQFEETKKKLAAEHCFDKERKKPLPPYPKRICVVTSPSGAVIHDILRVLSRRAHYYHLLIYPVSVQGSTAAVEIATALQQIQKERCADVIIIARGGGSLEDLWAFNEEVLVRAVAACHIPIISAVGHETDYTLCDFAADVRAPTPSVAAEIVCKESAIFHNYLNEILAFYTEKVYGLLRQAQKHLVLHQNCVYQQRYFYVPHRQRLRLHFSNASIRLKHSLDNHRRQNAYYLALIRQKFLHRLSTLRHLMHTAHMRILAKAHTHKELIRSFQLEGHKTLHRKIQFLRSKCLYQQTLLRQACINLSRSIHDKQNQWRHLTHLIQRNCLYSSQNYKTKLQHIRTILNSLNPRNVMQRGYAVLFNFNKTSVILSAEALQPKDHIKIALKGGGR